MQHDTNGKREKRRRKRKVNLFAAQNRLRNRMIKLSQTTNEGKIYTRLAWHTFTHINSLSKINKTCNNTSMVIIFIYKKTRIFHIISYLTCTMRRHKIFAFMLLLSSHFHILRKEKKKVRFLIPETSKREWKFPKDRRQQQM